MKENEIATIVVDAAFKVHTTLGPGLLESVYEEVLSFELQKRNLSFERQKGIPVIYEDTEMGIGFRADIVVEEKVIIELKSVASVLPVHQKQLLTYLKLMELKLGLLINFNEHLIKDGIQRIVNRL